ncbi:MAG: CDP-glucose 4,6-dehydratase [Verrucomicrobiota bacterium]
MDTKLHKLLTDTFRGKQVLVTGHTGFKGAWLCEWLLSLGAEVTGYSLPDIPTTPSLFEQLGLSQRVNDQRGDVRDSVQIRRVIRDLEPDFVFHLAAQPLVRLSYDQPVETWNTNVLGTIHILEALKNLSNPCVAVLITTDKVYENHEWLHGYRECDPLGGYDPYSSSKAAAELAIQSWRNSFFQKHSVKVASVRAGNVIGGGDWALDRIVPDSIRALKEGDSIPVRNKVATRPWQHVLEPLSGYLLLASRIAASVEVERLSSSQAAAEELCTAFNFGPHLESNRTVKDLVEEILKHWPGSWDDQSDPHAPHEAGKLNLVWDKSHHLLNWQPRWRFAETIKKTIEWYQRMDQGANPLDLTRNQIQEYSKL